MSRTHSVFTPRSTIALQLIYWALVGSSLVTSTFATPRSLSLILQGAERLRAGESEEALELFDSAIREDEEDSQAKFFRGVTLNRLGRFSPAQQALEEARRLGSAHPDLTFELGWSLLGQKRWNEAHAQLERYERAHPGRGQTSEFLGRTHMGLKDYEQAREFLEYARSLDPRLASSVDYHLARLESLEGNEGDARRQLDAFITTNPDSPLAKHLSSQADPLATLREPEPGSETSDQTRYQGVFSASAGFDSNVIAVGDGVPLPAEITDAGSEVKTARLYGSYRLSQKDRQAWSIGHQFLTKHYDDLTGVDLDDLHVFLSHSQDFGNDWSATLRLSDQYTWIGERDFRNQFSIRPALIRRHSRTSVTELAYAFADANYFFPSIPVQDRNSDAHTLSIVHQSRPEESKLGIVASAFHTQNNAVGGDFDFELDGLSLTLRHPLFLKLEGEVSYTRIWTNFEELHSLSGTTGFSFARDDDGHHLAVQIQRPIGSKGSIFARYNRNRNTSNIRFFDYRQKVVEGGASIRF